LIVTERNRGGVEVLNRKKLFLLVTTCPRIPAKQMEKGGERTEELRTRSIRRKLKDFKLIRGRGERKKGGRGHRYGGI